MWNRRLVFFLYLLNFQIISQSKRYKQINGLASAFVLPITTFITGRMNVKKKRIAINGAEKYALNIKQKNTKISIGSNEFE